jgi:hypothetical protein
MGQGNTIKIDTDSGWSAPRLIHLGHAGDSRAGNLGGTFEGRSTGYPQCTSQGATGGNTVNCYFFSVA